MRDDNTEPRDNQQIADDNQQSGVASSRDVEDALENRAPDEDREEQQRPPRTQGEEGPL